MQDWFEADKRKAMIQYFEKHPEYCVDVFPIPGDIRDNSAKYHHESLAPSETNREQDHRQSEQ